VRGASVQEAVPGIREWSPIQGTILSTVLVPGQGLPLAKLQKRGRCGRGAAWGGLFLEFALQTLRRGGGVTGAGPRRGGSGRPNGGRCGRAEGADMSTGVQCLERGGDFPLLIRIARNGGKT
jgi:hypothetical protein